MTPEEIQVIIEKCPHIRHVTVSRPEDAPHLFECKLLGELQRLAPNMGHRLVDGRCTNKCEIPANLDTPDYDVTTSAFIQKYMRILTIGYLKESWAWSAQDTRADWSYDWLVEQGIERLGRKTAEGCLLTAVRKGLPAAEATRLHREYVEEKV